MMNQISYEQLISRFPLSSLSDASVFGAIPEEAISWLLRHGTIREYAKDEQLFSQNQAGDSFHIVLDGTVDYYKYHNNLLGFIRSFERGEQIGFVSMIALHDRVGAAKGGSDCITLEVTADHFHDFHLSYPMEFGILMMNLAREMARNLRKTNNLLVEATLSQIKS